MLQRFVLALLLLAPALPAQQPPPPLDDNKALALYQRSIQLTEAGGMASPELGRAAAPLVENMRQTLDSLRFLGARNPQLHYRFLANLRAYLLVADTVPKPVPFPEVARQQQAELRDNLALVEVYFQSLIEQLQAELRSPDRDNLRRYREADLALPAPSPKNPRIVFLGDSITDFWRLNEYFPGRDFVNRGISGQITGQMLGRFYSDVTRLKPAAVLILAGTNDIARGAGAEVIQNNLTMICDLADAYKIKVILASILPVSDYHKSENPYYERTALRPPAAILEVNRWMESFSKQRGYVYLNYHAGLADSSGQLPAAMADDGLHPNPAGYRVMAPLALAAIEKALGGASKAQPDARKRRLF